MNYKALMLASALSAGSALAADVDGISLSVIVRDFQPSHSDFENFSEEFVTDASTAGKGQLPEEYLTGGDAIFGWYQAGLIKGYDEVWYGMLPYHGSCGNKASYPNTNYKAGVPLGKV